MYCENKQTATTKSSPALIFLEHLSSSTGTDVTRLLFCRTDTSWRARCCLLPSLLTSLGVWFVFKTWLILLEVLGARQPLHHQYLLSVCISCLWWRDNVLLKVLGSLLSASSMWTIAARDKLVRFTAWKWEHFPWSCLCFRISLRLRH